MNRLFPQLLSLSSMAQPLSGRLPIMRQCVMTFSASNLVDDKVLKDISDTVKKDKVVVYMKGSPDSPRCGFSKTVVKILELHGVQKFTHVDVLQDEAVREGVKKFANWPTIPQVYFNGEFIGGCDIMLDLHKTGKLPEELKKIGIQSKLEKAA